MEEQIGLFDVPQGQTRVCACDHGADDHGNGGRGSCNEPGCTCIRFEATGETRQKRPRARRTDPETSHQAARSVKNLTKNQMAVEEVLKVNQPVTDETLIKAYEHAVVHANILVEHERLPRQSPSGIRTRRKELVEQGRVCSYDKIKNSAGRQTIRWRTVV